MTRHNVTGDVRTFARIAAAFALEGIAIDHFHCIEIDEGREYVSHINLMEDGQWGPSAGDAWVEEPTGPEGFDKCVADEWHEH